MINRCPRPVMCALCQTENAQKFTVSRMWVLMPASGFGEGVLRWLFAVCDECLDHRRPTFEPHHLPAIDNWTGVWVRGESTLVDLERRVEKLEQA